MHLFFLNNRLKLGETNHCHFFEQMTIIQKQKKKTKIVDIVFMENYLEDYKLAKFRPDGFRSCQLGVKNVCLPVTLQNVCCKKKEKYFLQHLTTNRIIMPKCPCWCLPERDHYAIRTGVWQVICSRPNLKNVPGIDCIFRLDTNYNYQRLVTWFKILIPHLQILPLFQTLLI